MRKPASTTLFLGALLCFSAAAHAQFAWLDEKGQRVYSDQPPPPSVPDAKILHAPRGSGRVPADAEAAPAAAESAAKAPPTVAERELDYRKRREEADKAAAKTALEQSNADKRRANCDAAARNKQVLQTSTVVLTETRATMSDSDRARRLADSEQTLRDCR